MASPWPASLWRWWVQYTNKEALIKFCRSFESCHYDIMLKMLLSLFWSQLNTCLGLIQQKPRKGSLLHYLSRNVTLLTISYRGEQSLERACRLCRWSLWEGPDVSLTLSVKCQLCGYINIWQSKGLGKADIWGEWRRKGNWTCQCYIHIWIWLNRQKVDYYVW